LAVSSYRKKGHSAAIDAPTQDAEIATSAARTPHRRRPNTQGLLGAGETGERRAASDAARRCQAMPDGKMQ